MNNLNQQPIDEETTSKKEYNAPSIREFGEINNLVNAGSVFGNDGSPSSVC